MLDDFLAQHRHEIIRRCRQRVAARVCPAPTDREIDEVPPLIVNQLHDVLARTAQAASPQAFRPPPRQLPLEGLTLAQLIHDLGDTCCVVNELAAEAAIGPAELQLLNTCLDAAIASAVSEQQRPRLAPSGTDDAATDHALSFFVHELRNLVNTAIVAFQVHKTGTPEFNSPSTAIVQRSLLALRSLIARPLAQVRVAHGLEHQELIAVADVVREQVAAAGLEAERRGVALVAASERPDLHILADPVILAAVVGNLLQNAIKFTRPGTTVTISVHDDAGRVRIEVQDACGGLPDQDVEALFRPFEQRGRDRSGIGVGLAFSRWGTEVNGGHLYARNLPGHGCVFVVELPLPAAA